MSKPINSSPPNQTHDDFSPKLLEFLSVYLKCGTLGDLPHPIDIRNKGFIEAWQDWATWRGCQVWLANQLADRRYDLAEITAMITTMLFSGPSWKPGRIAATLDNLESIASTMAVILMYWHRPHFLIELTPTLEQWLLRSDLGDDIPADLLRPPMPACYIRFSPEMQAAISPSSEPGNAIGRIEGVYVLESMRDGLRSIVLMPITERSNREWSMCGIQMLIGDKEQRPLVDFIQVAILNTPEADHPGMAQHYQSIAQLCIKVFLYMSLSQSQQIEETPYCEALVQLQRVGPKKAAKLHRQINKHYDRILLGPQTLLQHAPGTHGEVSPHWRRGHFRLQAHGPRNSLRKVIFTAPILVRADRLGPGDMRLKQQPKNG